VPTSCCSLPRQGTRNNTDLSLRLPSYSNTFGIIGALLCTLSITALTMMPVELDFESEDHFNNLSSSSSLSLSSSSNHRRVTILTQRRSLLPFPSNQSQRRSCSPTLLLVKYLGISKHYLEDVYIASWAAAFYTSVTALGLSGLVAATVAATAPSYIKIFVRRHSGILVLLPVLSSLSMGFSSLGLMVGLDETRGTPISWIGVIGTLFGRSLLLGSTVQVLRCYRATRMSGKF
jgi:hypothetical protein